MEKSYLINIACPECEKILESKFFNEHYIVGVCGECFAVELVRCANNGLEEQEKFINELIDKA